MSNRNAKHTPGPWVVVKKVTPDGFPDWLVTDNAKDPVASVYPTSAESDSPNARLIAAAPELLENCTKFRELLEAMSAESNGAYKGLLETIAKATGGAE